MHDWPCTYHLRQCPVGVPDDLEVHGQPLPRPHRLGEQPHAVHGEKRQQQVVHQQRQPLPRALHLQHRQVPYPRATQSQRHGLKLEAAPDAARKKAISYTKDVTLQLQCVVQAYQSLPRLPTSFTIDGLMAFASFCSPLVHLKSKGTPAVSGTWDSTPSSRPLDDRLLAGCFTLVSYFSSIAEERHRAVRREGCCHV